MKRVKPDPSDQPMEGTLAKLLAAFGLKEPEPAACPDTPAREDTKFIAAYSNMADQAADSLARKMNCGCDACKLTVPICHVYSFMCAEIVRAAMTGDRSKLDALVAKVDELRGKK